MSLYYVHIHVLHTYLILTGLSLELYLEQHEYIPQLTETLGYNVVVHHQDNMAYPEDHSILITPGAKTHISITRVRSVHTILN